MDSFQVNQVFNVFRWSQRPADVATDPVKRQGFVSTELTSKLEKKHDWSINSADDMLYTLR